MGMTVVRGSQGEVAGIFTDGDLRRSLERIGDLRLTPVQDVMTRKPRHIGPDELAAAAADLMEQNRISQLLVLDAAGQLVGALHTLDLMRAKVI